MDLFEIISGGTKFTFHVVKNNTEPCPQCGVPACGKEDILWYEFNNKRVAIIFDGGYFDMMRDDFFAEKGKEMNYDSLTEFMKEWNEFRGWEDCWDYNGYELEIDDFLRTIALLKSCKTHKWMSKAELSDMEKLAKEAREKGLKLKIVRG